MPLFGPLLQAGFPARPGTLGEPEEIFDDEAGEKRYRYLVRMRVEKPGQHLTQEVERQFDFVLSSLSKAASSEGWTVRTRVPSLVGGGPDEEGQAAKKRTRPPLIVPYLTEDVKKTFFAGVYERDAHLRVIHDAISSYADSLSRWQKDGETPICRSHILLKGKPAAAKTTLFERLKAWLEHDSPVERITFIDLHMATKAGFADWLLEKAEQNELAEIV